MQIGWYRGFVRVATLVLLGSLVLRAGALAQEPSPAEPSRQSQPTYEEDVEVIGITPIHGLGLSILKVPANVQVFTADPMERLLPLDVPSVLSARAASVQVNEAQAGTFQPDLLFRGFVASPLLGASEGLAVYQDGVRLNEPFGDTVNWDAMPTTAIASINLIPGSNPLFGLNALGGALSLRTKDGFDFPGQHVAVSTGSFGRHRVEAESGGHGDTFGYYVAGTLLHERGWRDFSPSTIRRVFGDVAWRGDLSAVNVSVTAAANDLTGNGTAPLILLDADRRAVFTHPDETGNETVLVTMRARRQIAPRSLFEAVSYYRNSDISTFNGDAAEDDDDEGGDGADEDELHFDGVNNTSRTRGRSAGATGQLTWTAPLRGRDNHFIAGAGVDAAATRFDSAAELAHLTANRGTIGAGVFDDEAFVDLHTRTVTGSGFITDTWSVARNVAVTASARFNWTSVRLRDQIGTALSGDHSFRRLNPAAGVTYQARSWLNVYGSYAQSSRVPTPVELTCADPEDPCRLPNAFVSDPPLNQIVARTWETGVRRTEGPLRWALAAFSTDATDDIIFVSSGTLRGEGHFENIDRTRRRGIEASVEYDVRQRLSAFGAYTFQRATFGTELAVASPNHPDAVFGEIPVEEGDRLPGVPVHSAKAGVSVSATDKLNFGVNVRTQSGVAFRGDEANFLPLVPAFAVVDGRARYQLSRHVSALLQAQNLFDADYYTFGALGEAELLGDDVDDRRFFSPGAPRAAWVGLEVRF